MKILILANAEPGGEWIATQTIINALKKKDKSIKFYLLTLTKNEYLFKGSFEKIVYIKQKHYKKPLKYYRELFHQLKEGVKAIDNIFKEYRFDRVITIDYKLAISYLISQRGADYIYYFHGLKNYYKTLSDNLNHYNAVIKFLEIFAWTLSKKIIVPSFQTKTFLIKNYKLFLGKKIFIVIPNLIRNDFNSNHHQKNIKKEKNIVYSGRLDLNKGIRNLLYAFLRLTKDHPEFSLLIIYTGKPEIKLFSEIKSFIKNGYKIKLYKDLQTIDLVKIYRSSYFGILPSNFENSPLFLKEAFASNLPIFTTVVGDILPSVFSLKNNDSDTIYTKMIDFLKNREMYRKKALIQFQNWKKHYNESEIIDNFLKNI